MEIADLKKEDLENTISRLEDKKVVLEEKLKYLKLEADDCDSMLKFWKNCLKNYGDNGKRKDDFNERRGEKK